jgi:sialate O-acetylesterase
MNRTFLMPLLLAALVLCMSAGLVRAAVKPHSLISEGAVLQQGVDVPIWGAANDGEKVTVKFQGQEVSTTAKDGRWLLKLKPLKPGGPFVMTIAGENTLEIKDLLVGEVWVCSGQSNMEWLLFDSTNGPAMIEASTDPQLRLCKVPSVWPKAIDPPKDDVDLKWSVCGPKTAGVFSAVGYFFARDLRKKLNVPVGMISSCVGGSQIEWWLNAGAIESDPALRAMLDKNLYKTSLFNVMIAPLQPYAMRGVIWYQGESNSGNARQYRAMFPAMIRGWRDTWDQGEFPFLYVQVAPCANWSPEIREAQFLSLAKTKNTAMVVTADLGEEQNIHPKNKEPVGGRLALAARAVVYGEKIEYSGPLYESLKIEGGKAIVSFTHAASGLESHGPALTGFTIADEKMNFVDAVAKIDGQNVVVTSEKIAHPVAVRYGWASFPVVNLFNKDGLPASPFRSDAP